MHVTEKQKMSISIITVKQQQQQILIKNKLFVFSALLIKLSALNTTT